jgi:hypothetical protein
MTRLITCGWESGGPVEEKYVSLVNTPDISATEKRSGNYALFCDTTSQTAEYVEHTHTNFAAINSETLFVRFWFRFSGAPAFNTRVLAVRWASTTVQSVFLGTDRTMYLTNFTGNRSAVLAANTWHLVEFRARPLTGADEWELRVNGTVVVNSTAASGEGSLNFITIGLNAAPDTPGISAYFDDFAVNNSAGTSENSWPDPDGKIIALKPISDNARVMWTGGAGGTTNLYDAVNNTPPIGHSTETNLTQIEHPGGSATSNDDYDANMESYTTGGIGASDTIKVVVPVCIHGEDVSTGTKILATQVVSNPAGTLNNQFNAGDDAGALGIYPSFWKPGSEDAVYAPTPTLGTSPVMRVRRLLATGTRVASVCGMYLMVEYVPAPSGVSINVPLGQLALSGLVGLPTAQPAVPLGQIVFTGAVPALGQTLSVPLGQLVLSGLVPVPTAQPGVPLGQLTFAGLTPSGRVDAATPLGQIALSPLTPVPTAQAGVPLGQLVFTGFVPTISGQAVTIEVPLGQLTFAGLVPSAALSLAVPLGQLAFAGLAPNPTAQPGVPLGQMAFAGLAPSGLAGPIVPLGALGFTGLGPSGRIDAATPLGQLAFAGLVPAGVGPNVPLGSLSFIGLVPTPTAQAGVPLGSIGLSALTTSPTGRPSVPLGGITLTALSPSASSRPSVPLGQISFTGLPPEQAGQDSRVAPLGQLAFAGLTPSGAIAAPVPLGQLTLTGLVPSGALSMAIPLGNLSVSPLTPSAMALPSVPLGALSLNGLNPSATIEALAALGLITFTGKVPSLIEGGLIGLFAGGEGFTFPSFNGGVINIYAAFSSGPIRLELDRPMDPEGLVYTDESFYFVIPDVTLTTNGVTNPVVNAGDVDSFTYTVVGTGITGSLSPAPGLPGTWEAELANGIPTPGRHTIRAQANKGTSEGVWEVFKWIHPRS